MTESSQRFRQQVAEALTEDGEPLPGGAPGSHPSLEDLTAYHGGRLAAPEAERVRDHLVVCRECLDQLLELDLFVHAPEEEVPLGSRFEAARLWRDLQPRLAAGSHRPLAALAASLLLAVVGLGLWAIQQRSMVRELRLEVARLSQPQPDVPIVDLFPLSSVRGTGSGPAPGGSETGSGYLTLVLNLPEPAEADAYEAVIRDAGDREIWSGRLGRSEYGTLTLGIPRPFLGAGKHEILLYGFVGDRRRLLETYPLELASSLDSF